MEWKDEFISEWNNWSIDTYKAIIKLIVRLKIELINQ